ncbi:unannotated protein [freshwater metagenome]|uniref:L-cysteine:1D-myo-inositol 2-amino-2-deoxy-alpha-D-glucopyranoside ligase n=1 Tax=freshwater metagenome TaxID=449393 RepID=A0A6J7JD79_9ZZZZ|nr:cysteine--1-D-myo-inosityl 2-amino-2-deoxy-alpha-D-glucopyranoside ligase [Actinomycetota bacterium]MSW35443.1 cysteine--1-D-myo-inosityl 2-amino-2-deoxy-alpha-D-glucopyranoside ligase [Actinomycetota bacterium]
MKSWATVDLPPIAERFSFPHLNLFDTQSEEIRPLPERDIYRMYVCGITPYDATHLGHAATYLTFDLINRYLLASGKEVRYVQNITDIDDPLLERATRDGIDWRDLAHSQIELFRSDMTDLHVIPPQSYIGAVDSIDLVIKAIQELQKRDCIYEVDGDLYFSPSSDSEFGNRSHFSRAKMLEIFAERGGDPARAGKRDPLDCLVWLKQRPNEPGWPSPFGTGRPGWHIECSAIALEYVQPDAKAKTSIDIQGGGSDLIFPHHDMGAAQGALLQGKPFADFYVHGGMIGLDGEKMSKSKGNLVFVSKLIASGFDPSAIRIALMQENYRSDRMWVAEKIDAAQRFLDHLRLLLSRPEVAPTDSVIVEIIQAISANLDTPAALSALEKWCVETEDNATGGNPGELSRALDALLGIAL